MFGSSTKIAVFEEQAKVLAYNFMTVFLKKFDLVTRIRQLAGKSKNFT